jgi:undecaprenyl diphosphate synthase
MALKHIAVIPDGNRRWARKEGVSLLEGYKKGIEKLENLLRWCRDSNVKMLTLWGFSTENVGRERKEIKSLFSLFDSKLVEALKSDEYHRKKVRVRFLGKKDMFPKSIRQKIEKLERSTKNYDSLFLTIMLGYGGRQEIVDAISSIVEDAKKGRIKSVNERLVSDYLYTSGLPNPDLVIRTSGEQRLSGFLPWQSAYSELYFSKKLWPDFSKADFKKAVDAYSKRERRFGR